MIKFTLLTALVVFTLSITAQNVGIGTSTPNLNAALEIKASTKGLLIPRTSSASRTAIVNPPKGLLLYDSTTSSFWYHNDVAWVQMGSTGSGWSLTGNAATNPALNFIGTTNTQPLRFRVNNSWAGEIHPTTGNVFLGAGSGMANTTGEGNTAIGDHSLFANTEGDFNTAIGNYALPANTTGFNNSAIGVYALRNNTTGESNTALGRNALFANTIGYANTATGVDALLSNNGGYYNTANGYGALYSNNTGSRNTANGAEALRLNTTGVNNTATGSSTMYNNTTGLDNTANGAEALLSNTIGGNNTATGRSTMFNNTTGSYNTAMGMDALRSNATGFWNTAVGHSALGTCNGNLNIGIGIFSGTHPATPNVFNTISIGNDDLLNAYQNQAFIGNSSTLFIGGKVNWGVISDARVKNNVLEDVKGLDFILRLRPVTYCISSKAIISLTGNKATPDFPGKYDGEKIKYTGFLAQEVEQAAKAANYDFSGYDSPKNEWGFYSIKYAEFVVPLVKAVQEQQGIIQSLQKKIETTNAEIPIQLIKQQYIIDEQNKKIELLLKEMQLIKKKLK